MKRSHSRTTYKFDKSVDVELCRWFRRVTNRNGGKKTVIALQKSKQRQYDKRLVRDSLSESQ